MSSLKNAATRLTVRFLEKKLKTVCNTVILISFDKSYSYLRAKSIAGLEHLIQTVALQNLSTKNTFCNEVRFGEIAAIGDCQIFSIGG